MEDLLHINEDTLDKFVEIWKEWSIFRKSERYKQVK